MTEPIVVIVQYLEDFQEELILVSVNSIFDPEKGISLYQRAPELDKFKAI